MDKDTYIRKNSSKKNEICGQGIIDDCSDDEFRNYVIQKLTNLLVKLTKIDEDQFPDYLVRK